MLAVLYIISINLLISSRIPHVTAEPCGNPNLAALFFYYWHSRQFMLKTSVTETISQINKVVSIVTNAQMVIKY